MSKVAISTMLLFLIIVFCNCEQANTSSQDNSHTLPLANIETISSKILGEDREVWVHVPAEFYGMDTTDIKFPVIYMVDADGHFLPWVGMMDQLSSRFSANDECPPHIVVGIRNPNRNYDLTPPTSDPEEDHETGMGGADEFIKFVGEELIPFINKKYPVAPYTTLAGHSFGGLFVMNTLFENQDLFDNYIAIDPAVFWEDGAFVKKSIDAFKNQKFKNKRAYIIGAGPGFRDMTKDDVKSDTTELVSLTRDLLMIYDVLDNVTPIGLDLKYELAWNENHYTVPLKGFPNGLKHIYEGYHFDEMIEYYDKDSPVRNQDIVESIEGHFEKLSTRMGYKVKPLESYVNAWAMGFGYNGEPEFGAKLYNYNLKNYPSSPFVHAANGHFRLSQNDTLAAIKSFENSINLSPDNGLSELLSELKI